jgi:Uncharacterized conserved protein
VNGAANIRSRLFYTLQIYLFIFLGSAIAAAGINLFLVPNKIAPGGVSGIATVLFYLSNGRLPVGMTMLAFDIPLYLIGYRFIGRRFIVKTMYSSITLSLLIDFSKPFFNMISEKYFTSSQSGDLIVFTVFGGLMMGLGLGIVFKSGATTGGTDLAAKILHTFIPKMSLGNLLMCLDGAVIVFAALSFNSIILGLYAIITIFIMSKVIDALMEGVNFSKCVFIISEKSDIISDTILRDIDRGVTALKGTGMYTKKDKEVLFCVMDRSQIPRLKEIVQDIDERAFIILTDAREVLGEGFQNYNREIQ